MDASISEVRDFQAQASNCYDIGKHGSVAFMFTLFISCWMVDKRNINLCNTPHYHKKWALWVTQVLDVTNCRSRRFRI